MLLGPQIKKRQDVCRLKLSKILLANIIARKCDWPNGGKVRLGGASVPLHSRSEKLGSTRRLQAVRFKRRKSFEVRRGGAVGVGAGVENFDAITAGEIHREFIAGLFIEDVGAVAGGAGEDDWARDARAGGAEAVFDAFVEGFGQTAKFGDVEIDPSGFFETGFLRDENDFALDDAGFGDEEAARFEHDVRTGVAECVVESEADGVGISIEIGNFAVIANWKTAPQIHCVEEEAFAFEKAEKFCGFKKRFAPLRGIHLLRTDVERYADRVKAKFAREEKKVAGHVEIAAKLFGERPAGVFAGGLYAAHDGGLGSVNGEFAELGFAIESVAEHTAIVGVSDIGGFLDGVSVGETAGLDAKGEAHINFGAAGDIEVGAHIGKERDDFPRGIGFYGVVHGGGREVFDEFAVLGFDDIEIDGQERRLGAREQELLKLVGQPELAALQLFDREGCHVVLHCEAGSLEPAWGIVREDWISANSLGVN